MIPSPLISVIVPCYNGAAFLAQALDSILAQTCRPLEIILIDDGSTDESATLARRYDAVRYAYQEHAGLGAALNHGIELATGAYVAFLDADDVWIETKLASQMLCFQNDPALEIVFGHVQQFCAEQLVGAPIEGYFKSALLIRRDAFERVGYFDPQWRVGDFVDWYMRAREMNIKSTMLDEVVTKRRIHENNMSARERAHNKAYVHILKRSLDRRRQQNS